MPQLSPAGHIQALVSLGEGHIWLLELEQMHVVVVPKASSDLSFQYCMSSPVSKEQFKWVLIWGTPGKCEQEVYLTQLV